MPLESKKLPGVVLVSLSALGILFGILGAVAVVFSLAKYQEFFSGTAEILSLATTGALSLMVGLLHIPTLIFSVRALHRREEPVRSPSLFRAASLAGIAWFVLLAAGALSGQSQSSWMIFIPLTLLAAAIPVWWLVEFGRKGLKRSSALREWGVFTISLSVVPVLIMVVELMLVVLISLLVLIILGSQPVFLQQFGNILHNLDMTSGDIGQLEQMLMELARNPVIASALLLVIGVITPFVEELFKPMALWFLLKSSIKDSDGFTLGLVSGGAFALLESAGMISQISPDTWVQAVTLRAGTGLLHIGLSGLVGYGLATSWNHKHFGGSLLYLLGAVGLHGAWNSLTLLNSFASQNISDASLVEFQLSTAGIISIAGMAAIFAAVLFITLRINQKLRQSPDNHPEEPASNFLRE